MMPSMRPNNMQRMPMKLVKSFLWISIVVTCVGFCVAKDKEQVSTTVHLICALDAAICKLDQPAMTAALKNLEQASVQVRLLPFLKKLQNVAGAKRRWPKIAAWTGVPAGCVGSLVLAGSSEEVDHLLRGVGMGARTATTIAANIPLVVLAAVPITSYMIYQRWARCLHQRVCKITNLLLASPVLIVGADVPLVEHAVTELTRHCGSSVIKA